MMTLALSTPVWVDHDAAYTSSWWWTPPPRPSSKLFGARANYTLRINTTL